MYRKGYVSIQAMYIFGNALCGMGNQRKIEDTVITFSRTTETDLTYVLLAFSNARPVSHGKMKTILLD